MARPRGTGAPTALKLLKGNPAPNRINRDEPQPDDGVPECPTKDREVRAIWDYTVRQLVRMRTITMADRDALHTYCEQVVQYRIAAEMVRKDGAIINIPRVGPRKHPALAIMKECAALIKTYGRDFGLSPAARTAIRVTDQRPPQTEAGAQRLLSS
jgi:P27 family predicted phage terminase small subunit